VSVGVGGSWRSSVFRVSFSGGRYARRLRVGLPGPVRCVRTGRRLAGRPWGRYARRVSGSAGAGRFAGRVGSAPALNRASRRARGAVGAPACRLPNRGALDVCGRDVLLDEDSVLCGVMLGAFSCGLLSQPTPALVGCSGVPLGAYCESVATVSPPFVEAAGSTLVCGFCWRSASPSTSWRTPGSRACARSGRRVEGAWGRRFPASSWRSAARRLVHGR